MHYTDEVVTAEADDELVIRMYTQHDGCRRRPSSRKAKTPAANISQLCLLAKLWSTPLSCVIINFTG